MTIHNEAQIGDISDKVLLPGDPLRAKYISEKFLENSVCYNNIRGMKGYTGNYKGNKISIQATGMGIPSALIYINELIEVYKAKKLIRIGTCGAIQENIKLLDIILPMSVSTDSSFNKNKFYNCDYAPCADYGLLSKAFSIANDKKITTHVGSVLTSDIFYKEDKEFWKIWSEYGTLAIEMETSALYTLACKYNVKALSVLTVSDSIILEKQTTAREREITLNNMIEISLETIIK